MGAVEPESTSAIANFAEEAVGQGMSWLEFIATMFESLMSVAWPVAVVLSVWLFRREIGPLLPHMRLKHKETEISFRLDEAERVVNQLPPPADEVALAPPEEISHFEKIARLSPRAALMEMRREVETVLNREADRMPALPWKKNVVGATPHHSPRQILRVLRSKNAIDSTAANLFEDVLAIGNIAAHDDATTFTFEDAMRYRNVVDQAMRFLEIPPVNGPEDYPTLLPQEGN